MKKLSIVFIVLLLLCGCNKKKIELVDETGELETVKVEKYDGTNGTSCYDFIVDTMAKPQYWDGSITLPYSNAESVGIEGDPSIPAKEKLVNGTGFYLSDEATATFSRGYQSTFSLHFSSFTADTVVHKELIPYFTEKFDGYYYDFNNDVFERTRREGKVREGIIKNEDNVWSLPHLPYTNGNYLYSANNSYMWLKDDVLEYERKFAEAGCPLLNQPEGTLTEYKEVLAHPENVTDNGKINGPWELEGYKWDYTEYEGITWTTDLQDLLDTEVPYTDKTFEVRSFVFDEDARLVLDENGTPKKVFKDLKLYSMAMAAVVYPDNLDSYIWKEGSTIQFESTGGFFERLKGSTGAFAAYYLTPVLKELYGKNVVYLVDSTKLTGTLNLSDLGTYNRLKTQMEDLLNLSGENVALNEKIIEYFPYVDGYENLNAVERMDTGLVGAYVYEWYIYCAYDAFGKEMPFASDYLYNCMLPYNIRDQRILGLR